MLKKLALPAACLLTVAIAPGALAAPQGALQKPPIIRADRPAPTSFGDGRISVDSRAEANDRRGPKLLGGVASDTTMFGVGLWRVPKTDTLDPNRSNPLRSTEGRSSRIGGVGLNLRF